MAGRCSGKIYLADIGQSGQGVRLGFQRGKERNRQGMGPGPPKVAIWLGIRRSLGAGQSEFCGWTLRSNIRKTLCPVGHCRDSVGGAADWNSMETQVGRNPGTLELSALPGLCS